MTKWDDDALKACVGKTASQADGFAVDSENALLSFSDGTVLRMYHSRGCCETVSIVQVDGDAEDLLDSPLLMAETVSSEDAPAPEHHDSYTWTFVKFGTVKGYVTVRWLGESNGYYSETPSITLKEES